jgi:hypothetical protein
MPEKKVYNVHGAYYVPGTPEHKNWMNNVQKAGTASNWSHGQTLPATKPVAEENYIRARRADPLGKFGGKDRLETSDYGYDKETMGNLLKAYKDAAEKHGVKMLHPDELTNMALVEGRSNFGYNDYNVNNKRAAKIAADLMKAGHDPYAAGFPAAIIDKQQTAQRLKVPFTQVWNGGGSEARNYAKRLEQQKYAVEAPKNQDLRNYIKSTLGYKVSDSGEEMPEMVAENEMQPQVVASIEPEDTMFKRGGSVKMPSNYSGGNWKLI